jgi:CubicO group peptidase (beta-lactamase class C family)
VGTIHLKILILTCLVSSSLLFATTRKQVRRLDNSTISPSEIDAPVLRLAKEANVPGIGIAIFNNGEIAYLKAFGLRDKDRNLPLTPDSVMTAASLSKPAFAYLVMKLVDEGQLDLDKPAYQYLPRPLSDYSRYADLKNDPRYKLITARMLLSHTSGFPNWRVLEDDRKLKIHFQPGTRFAYSGEGIDLLQLVVETITKQPLEELMQEKVFQPLGMKRTSMVWQPRFDNEYANGYDENERSLGPQRRKIADAAGSMQTTLHDFALFMQAMMSGKGLRPKTWHQMLSSQVQINSRHEFPTFENVTTDKNKTIRLSYGLGWGLYWTPYGKAFFKEGHDEGWRNYTVCFSESKLGMLIMTNSSNGEGIYKELLESLIRNNFTPIEWEGFTPYNQSPNSQPKKK